MQRSRECVYLCVCVCVCVCVCCEVFVQLTEEGEVVPVDEVAVYGEAVPAARLAEHVQLIVRVGELHLRQAVRFPCAQTENTRLRPSSLHVCNRKAQIGYIL